METLFDMAKRHKSERLALMKDAVWKSGSVAKAAKAIGADRSVIYRELRSAGVDVDEILAKRELASTRIAPVP